MVLYLKIEQSICVNHEIVLIEDIGSMYCQDKEVLKQIKRLELFRFKKQEEGREIYSILPVIEKIKKKHPQIEVENMGETDFLLYYKPPKNENKLLIWLKIIGICILSFFGAGYAIMTYNNDVATFEVFELLERLALGKTDQGVGILSITYSLGLTIGILIFFNHAASKKLTSDPTPFQVQMRLYEQDVNNTFIKGASRKGEEIDVD